MDGEVRHEQISKLNDRVVAYADAAQVVEEETPPAEDVQAGEEAPPQEEASVPAEDETTPLEEEELAPAAEEDAEEDNAMPMRDNGEEDWQATTPEHAHSYIFNEAGLSQREGNEFVAAQKDAAQRAPNKAKSAQAPRVGTSIRQYNEAKAKHQEKIDNAQRVLDYWNAVQDIQVAIQHKEREQKEAEDAKAHEEAKAQMQAEFEARKAAEAEAMERRKAESLQEDGDSETSIVGVQDGAEQKRVLKEDEDPQGNVASSKEESPTDFTPSPRTDGEDVIEDIQAGDGHSIEPTNYTNKKGKTTPMHLVRFERKLSKEEIRAGKEIAKESRGWWDSKQGGFMMRSEEAAKALAESLSNEEAVQDAQPLSVEDMAAVTDKAEKVNEESANVEEKAEDTEEAILNRQEAEREEALTAHGVKIGDKVLYNGNEATIYDADKRQVILDTGLAPVMYEATDWGNISVQDAESKPQEEEDKKPKSKWVGDEDAERFEELRKRLKQKIRGQLNIGVDPEILTIGIEMSYLVLKNGARKFKDFAEQLLGAVGEEVRPYLKAFYNGARDLPEMEDYAKELTPYDEVRTFDVKNFDKEGAKDIVDTAEYIVREQEAERDAKEVSDKLKEERNERRKESEQQIESRAKAVEEASKSEDVRFRQGESAARELAEVNERFNRELAELTEENADTKIFNLGSPSSILLSAGVEDKPMKLYGNKIIKKMKKHSFALEELQDLPKAVANPIAVFDNYQQEGNRTILTELRSQGKNIMVAVTLGKNGVDVDFNIVSSVFGKGSTNIVDWISKGYLAYVDKEKALNYLYFSERNISEAAENSELSSAANILKDFENPTIEGKNHTALSENILPTEPLRDRKAMRNEAAQLAEKLHTPINIVEDANEITHPNKEIEARRRKAKGWYNVSTGEVVVVLANHKDAADVAATICHEVIAHKGVRELVGEAHYDEFLDEVYDHLRGDLKREIDDAAGRAFLDDINKSGDDVRDYKRHRRIAVDELFGSLAEKPFEEFSEGERSLWQKIKEFAKKLLDRFLDKLKLPKWFELGDNELRYILWRSKERLERGKEDPIDQAKDIVKREELGLTNEPLNKVSVTARSFEELAEQNEWNPKPIRGEEMVDLYEIAPKVTTHDYYLGTKAEFKRVKSTENVWDAWEKLKQQDGFRYVHSPKSDSEYLVNDETGEIYRISDHWGWVASCRWSIDDQAPSGFNIGKANIKDFERIKGNYVFTPEAQRIEPGHETYLRAKENLERALKDDTYKFTAAARRLAEEKVRSYQSNAEFYEQNHESGDIVYRRNEFGKYIPYREMKHSREQWFEGYISDEEREIVERAQADGSYMKAPNGKPSNLNGKQWAQVRTKAFKKWFGDWEKAARIEKLRKSEPVVISGNEYKGKYELNRDSAKAWIKENLRGEYIVADTGKKLYLLKLEQTR